MESKPKILIVEDEESQRSLYCEELKDEGYHPIPAENGKEAIQLLRNFKPDLIVLDIVMPVMDGMEALGRIVGKHKDIPIILHTAYSKYKQDFMSWAADAYVMKSSDLTELKGKIRDLLDGKKTEFEVSRQGRPQVLEGKFRQSNSVTTLQRWIVLGDRIKLLKIFGAEVEIDLSWIILAILILCSICTGILIYGLATLKFMLKLLPLRVKFKEKRIDG